MIELNQYIIERMTVIDRSSGDLDDSLNMDKIGKAIESVAHSEDAVLMFWGKKNHDYGQWKIDTKGRIWKAVDTIESISGVYKRIWKIQKKLSPLFSFFSVRAAGTNSDNTGIVIHDNPNDAYDFEIDKAATKKFESLLDSRLYLGTNMWHGVYRGLVKISKDE